MLPERLAEGIGKAPSLPKGLPQPPGQPTTYLVFITQKQWRKAKASINQHPFGRVNPERNQERQSLENTLLFSAILLIIEKPRGCVEPRGAVHILTSIIYWPVTCKRRAFWLTGF